MRNLITISLLLISALAFGQSETHNMTTYDTIIPYRGTGSNGQNWVVRITRPVNYFTAGNPDTASRPVIMTMQGDGEVSGGNYTFKNNYGPHWLLANNGWDGSIVLGNGTHYPLLITVQQNAVNTRPNLYGPLIDSLYKEFHWRGGIRYGGLSGGVECGGWVVGYQATAGNEHYMSMFSCFVNLSGVSPSNPESILGAQPMAYPNLWGYWAHKYGGHYLSTLGNADNQTSTYVIEEMINDSVPGAAYFSWVNIDGGGHGGWNSQYDQTQLNWTNQTPFGNSFIVTNGNAANTPGNYQYNPTTGESLLQWMLRQGDTSLVVPSPVLKWTMQLGEYGQPAIHVVNGIGVPYVFSSNSAFSGNGRTPGIPAAIVNPHSSLPSFIWCANTIHGAIFCDINGMIWFIGGNEVAADSGYLKPTDTLREMLVDSRGVALTGVSLATGVYTQCCTPLNIGEGLVIIKHGALSDTAFYLGHEINGIGGNGTVEDSVRLLPTMMFSLPFPGSTATRIVEMTGEAIMVMRLSDGTVWTFGDGTQTPAPLGRPISGINYASPGQVTIPNGDSIVQVAGGAVPGVLVLGKSGKLYGWGHYSGYLGNAANTVYATPTDLTTNITSHLISSITGAQLGITQIAGNSSCWHLIASDGSLWGLGDNGQGVIGNGIEANMSAPGGSSSPWDLDPTAILLLPQTLPIQVTNKHNWKHIYSGYLFTHNTAVIDDLDSLFYDGRNKGGVLPNGMLSCNGDGGLQDASYANAKDMPYLSQISPLAVTSTIQQSVLGCHTGQLTTHCFTCGVTTSVTANAGSNQSLPSGTTTTQLNGTGSASVGGVIPSWQHIWRQVSGPPSAIDVQASPTPNVALSGNGTYVYKLVVTDQGFNTDSSTVTVVVGSATVPTVSAGSNQTITLPTASVTLAGSATAISPATSITTYAWTQTSGPNTGTFSSTSIASPTFSSLIAGTYVLKLTVTDNSGNTNNASVTITVNAIPTVSAGSNQMITVGAPLTLTGTASASVGATITVTAWMTVSGPTSPMITSPASLSTGVTGLIAGTYVFQLTVTDNNGNSNSSNVTIIISTSFLTSPYRVSYQ